MVSRSETNRGKLSVVFGKNIEFASDAVCVFGKMDDQNFGEDTINLNVTIDGTGGDYYTIPNVYCGLYTTSSKIADSMSVQVSLKNAGIGNFYGAGSTASETGFGTMTSLELLTNAKVSNLYCGGFYHAGKAMKIFVEDETAQIDEVHSGCLYSDQTPEDCQFIYKNVGSKEKAYAINAQPDYKGFTTVNLENSYVKLDNSANSCAASEIQLKGTSGISLDSRGYSIKGNYIASEDTAKPSEWYCSNAATVRIEGSVSGYTKVMASNTLNQEENPGKFNNGFTVFAKTATQNNEQQFTNYENKSLDFTAGADYDKWEIADSEDNAERVNVYVADYGNDIALGNYSQPVKTLGEAFRKSQQIYAAIQANEGLSEAEKQEKISNLAIILLTDIKVTDGDSEVTGLTNDHFVTVRSESDKTKNNIILSDKIRFLGLQTNVRLDNVVIKNTCGTKAAELYANGHELVVTDKLETEALNYYYPILYGGAKSTEVTSTNMKIYGGKWSAIYGGGQDTGATVTSDVMLTAGKNIDMYNVGLYSETSTGLFGGGQFAKVQGKITVVIDGGKYLRIHGGGKNQTAATGAIEVDFNSGKTNMLYGGGENAASDSIVVNIGNNAEKDIAEITFRFRGSALYGSLNTKAETNVNVYSNAKLDADVGFAAGGYSGELYKANLHIYGGEINCDVHTGGWGEGTPGNKGTTMNTEFTITGGTVNGNIYGGGNLAIVSDKAILNVKGGKITGNIYGGGNAAGVKDSQVNINSSETVNGNVFGGSYNIKDEAGDIQETSLVKLENTSVQGAVFGGSDTSGLINNTVKVEISGSVKRTDGIYGGGSKAPLKICPEVVVDENAVCSSDIFGGGKGELKITNSLARTLLRIFTESDLVDANVPSTNVVINGTVTGDVFGGGEYATVGTTDENATEDGLDKVVSSVAVNGTVTGKVYGGGKGEKGRDYAAVNGSTKVTLGTNGNVTVKDAAENAKTGVVFGGGQNAPVAGNTNVNIDDGTYSTIFGGNDISGEIEGNTNVQIAGGKTEHIYGAGRDAAYSGSGTKVVVNVTKQNTGDNTADVAEVYGGGYGKTAVTNQASVTIQNGKVTTVYAGGNAADTKNTEAAVTGGDVKKVFGGGNEATVTESSNVEVNTTDDIQHVDTVFAGNNKAAMAIKPDLSFKDGKIGDVYCGGNQGVMTYKGDDGGLAYEFAYPNAEITNVYAGCNDTEETTSNVKLTLVSGKYGTVYGGNNQNGNMDQTDVIVNAEHGKEDALTVETVCLLGRKIVNDKNVEYAHVDYEPKDAEYLKSAKGSASYREIKEWIKEQHDVSVSNLYIAQVKDKLGFGKRENYNKGADGHRVPNCPAEKEKLILEAFKHFRMI